MPVVVGPKQPSEKKNQKSRPNVDINQPIGKMFIPGGKVIEPTAKAAQVNITEQDDVANPIVVKEDIFSDPNVETETVDPDLMQQIRDSANHLALED